MRPKALGVNLPAAPVTGVIGDVAAAAALVVKKPDDAGTPGAVPLGATPVAVPVGKGAPEAEPGGIGILDAGALGEAAADDAPEPPPGAADEARAAAEVVGVLGEAPPPTVTVW